jgi:diguanylate cyclase (GGDEF)-like protein/PAS domain S-box-containing protein
MSRRTAAQRISGEPSAPGNLDVEALLRCGAIGMLESDLSGRVTVVNAALLDLLGRDRSEVIGADVTGLLHPSDPAGQFDEFRALLAGQVDSCCQRRVFGRADGGAVDVVVLSAAIEAGNGDITGLSSIVVAITPGEPGTHDVSADDVSAGVVLAGGREDFVEALLDSLDVGIVACDARGRLTQFNATSRGWHGIDARADLDPGRFAKHFSLYESDGSTPMRMERIPLLRALHEGHVADAEMLISPRDLPATRVVCNGRALHAPNGSVIGAVVAMHDVTEQRRLQDDLRFRSSHDSLTGLPNRELLADRLDLALAQRASRPGRGVAVLVLDLDDFKVVNDTHGHEHGDLLLVEAATLLMRSCREGDTVARLGGDEFAVVLPDTDLVEALRVTKRITDAFAEPLLIGCLDVHISASVGVVLADGQTRSDLMRQADIAMYSAKSQVVPHVVYDADVHREVVARFELELELRGVAERGELVLEYQPVLDLATHRIVKVEALVRWDHPVHGRIPPLAFIPLAESSGSICAIGDWVLETACRQLVAWDAEHPGSGLGMAVNLSPRQLLNDDLVGRVGAILTRVGVAPGRIVLEVTESALGGDTEAMIVRLLALKALGVRLAIDDFGTGFSSLSYLRRLPVDILKVDKAFVAGIARDPAEWALTAAVIKLAKSLGKQTIAEGIELGEQLAHLRALNCDLGQGYLFDRPLAPAALSARLAERHDRAP